MFKQHRPKILCVILVIFLLSAVVYASTPEPLRDPATENIFLNFQHIGQEQGFKYSRITSIVEDRTGYIWIGTWDGGLIRYDGYSVKEYNRSTTKRDVLSITHVSALYEDSRGVLWVGTPDGLNIYNPEKDGFVRVPVDSSKISIDGINYITAICEGADNSMWIGTNAGLLHIPISDSLSLSEEKTVERLQPLLIMPDPTDSQSAFNLVHSLQIDNDKTLWIGTQAGIGLLSLNKKIASPRPKVSRLSELLNPSENMNTIVWDLHKDDDGRIWSLQSPNLFRFSRLDDQYSCAKIKVQNFSRAIVPIELPGKPTVLLYKDLNNNDLLLDPTTLQTYPVAMDTSDTHGFYYQSLSATARTSHGSYLIGTVWGGIYHYDAALQFMKYHPHLNNIISSSPSNLRFAFEDSRGDFWFASNKLYRSNRFSGEILDTFSSEGVFGQWSYLNKIAEDDNGTIWIGAEGKGLAKYDPSTGRFSRISLTSPYRESSHPPTKQTITELHYQSPDILWVASVEGDGNSGRRRSMLYQLDCNTLESTAFVIKTWHHSFTELGQEFIYNLTVDRNNDVWLATGFGLAHLNTRNGDVRFIQSEKSGLDINQVLCVTADPLFPNRYLWLGVAGAGLNRYDILTDTILHFKAQTENWFDDVACIFVDDNNRFWLGTNTGIYTIDLDEHRGNILKYWHYDQASGLREDNFRSFYGSKSSISANGELMFCGSESFAIFSPNDIQSDEKPLAAFISNIEINNKPSDFASLDSPLDKPISLTRQIILPYEQNTISLEMTALSFRDVGQVEYAYKLEGYDGEWVENGNSRIARYTKLPSGTFHFQFKVWNSDGVESAVFQPLMIKIKTPLWRSVPAFILYTILIIAAVYFLIWTKLNQERLNYELSLKAMETDKLEELDRLKSDFFTNASHELRTPLTLILGPVNNLLKSVTQKEHLGDLRLIRNNASHLLTLINDLLDFSKIEVDHIRIKAARGNIALFIKKLVMSFESAAHQKNIELIFTTDQPSIYCYYDANKIQKIVYNLVSNAIKYTKNGGKITVAASPCSGRESTPCLRTEGCARITVQDTGIGIPQKDLPRIFDRFYRAPNSALSEGTGIGLSLVKEFVELHGGYILVNSQEGVGSTFSFHIPLGTAHLQESERINNGFERQAEGAPKAEAPAKLENDKKQDVRYRVLIIEDNPDVRSYIANVLKEEYSVLQAADGLAGFDRAKETMPDLIVSDVMMPGIDGYELCEKIKTEELTSHIPVILLTARAATTDKIDGLDTGADDYIVKPFDEEELLARIRNLIEQRRQLRLKFAASKGLRPADIAVTSADKIFLERTIVIIENHFEDEAFSVPTLASLVGMSRSGLHRKLKALTDLSTNEFILSIRLQRAHDLLQQNAASVSEIAYQVGFKDPSYFTRAFHKKFGVAPSQINSTK